MKIKRTKTGNKISDSKHEIVKSEMNGNINNEDSASAANCKKQSNSIGVPSSPSSSANKRGNNSHRKDKTKDKLQVKEKSDIVPSNHQETQCSCGSDKIGGLPCTNFNCAKQREVTFPPKPAATPTQLAPRYLNIVQFKVS